MMNKEAPELVRDVSPQVVRALRQATILTVVMLSALGCYLIVLKWRGPQAAIVTATAWDDALPFWPAWVWVYLGPYLVGPVIVGTFRPETFWWYIRCGLVTVGVTMAIFIAVPTRTAQRPADELPPGPTRWMYEGMVQIDEPPANAAPSLHVSLTCLLALALFAEFPRYWPVTAVAIGLVWLATLLTRQHHLIDVATGVALALAVAWGMGRLRLGEPAK